MVAPLGDLQIGKVFGREFDALRRHEVRKRIVGFGQVIVHGTHDLVGGMRSGDRENLRVRLPDDVALGTETAGYDDLAILGERFANGIERFFHRCIDEAAGIDHDQIRIPIAPGDEITFGAKLREDALRINKRLWAAERNESDLGLLGLFAAGVCFAGCHAMTGIKTARNCRFRAARVLYLLYLFQEAAFF